MPNLTLVLNNDILSQRIYGEKLPFKGWQKCISFFFCEKSAGCCLFIVLTLKCGIFTAFFTNVFGSMNSSLLFLLSLLYGPMHSRQKYFLVTKLHLLVCIKYFTRENLKYLGYAITIFSNFSRMFLNPNNFFQFEL